MTTTEIVIIGAGVMGLSTAYHLAKNGCNDVIVLEKEEQPGLGSTGKNAGGIRYQFSSKVNIELSKLSFKMFQDFETEMDQPIDLNLCGYLFLIDNENSLSYFKESCKLQNSLGVNTQIISVDEIDKLVPEFNLDGIIAGSFNPGDGLVDPAGVVNGYAGQARRMGIKILCDYQVTEVVVKHNQVIGVSVGNKFIHTSKVLIAAGPWSGQVGKMAGLDLPIEPLRRQLAITLTPQKIRRDFPFVVDFTRSLYFHYEGGGILTGMSNRDEETGFDQSIDEDWRETHITEAVRRLPLLSDAELINEWAGLYEMTPDCQPILGAIEAVEGLFTCTGFSGHGFMHGPACGQLMAEEILMGRTTTVNIDELRYSRFSKRGTKGERNVV